MTKHKRKARGRASKEEASRRQSAGGGLVSRFAYNDSHPLQLLKHPLTHGGHAKEVKKKKSSHHISMVTSCPVVPQPALHRSLKLYICVDKGVCLTHTPNFYNFLFRLTNLYLFFFINDTLKNALKNEINCR